MPNKLTDSHIDELEERGYVIVHNFLDEEQRKEIAAAVRRTLKPWNEIEEAPPEGRWDYRIFPFSEPILNEAAVNRNAIEFARQWFRTDHIHFRPRSCLVRYPRLQMQFAPGPPRQREQLSPATDGGQNAQADLVLDSSRSGCGGSGAATADRSRTRWRFRESRATWYAKAAPCAFFTRTPGTPPATTSGRMASVYTWGFAFGHGDHYWEGVRHYTDVGHNTDFREFISGLRARGCELFRCPPAGHRYYTAQTLGSAGTTVPGLERAERVPSLHSLTGKGGWDASGPEHLLGHSPAAISKPSTAFALSRERYHCRGRPPEPGPLPERDSLSGNERTALIPPIRSIARGTRMTDEQKYLFDLNGFLVVPGVLSPEECRRLREFIVTLKNDPESLPDHEHYASTDPDPTTLHLVTGPSSELLDHPVLVDILAELVAGDGGGTVLHGRRLPVPFREHVVQHQAGRGARRAPARRPARRAAVRLPLPESAHLQRHEPISK